MRVQADRPFVVAEQGVLGRSAIPAIHKTVQSVSPHDFDGQYIALGITRY